MKRILIGLMACLAIGVSMAQAQTYYTIKNMGVVEGMKACEPAAMNSLGQVTGIATAGEDHAAFLFYHNGKVDRMEDIGGLGSRGFAINPAGIVAGDFFLPKQTVLISHAALIIKGKGLVDLGVLKGMGYSRANGINATQQVVGYSGLKRDSVESRAFIWTSNTGMIDIGTLGGAYAQATAINDVGFVTGSSQINNWVKNAETHAFIYQPLSDKDWYLKPMQDLGTLGGTFSYGTALNASNHVVGYSTMKPLDGRVHAFFHGGEKMIDLGALDKEGFDHSAALSINNAKQVVGVAYFLAGDTEEITQTAFIWTEKNQMVNLNRLIGTQSKAYWLLSAVSINDSGQITATAYDRANNNVIGVLLNPAK